MTKQPIGRHTANILRRRFLGDGHRSPIDDFLDDVKADGHVRQTGNHPLDILIDHFNQFPGDEAQQAWGRRAALLITGARNELARLAPGALDAIVNTVTHP